MRKSILVFLVFSLLFSIAPSLGLAASAVPKAPELVEKKAMTKKELRKQKRVTKAVNFIKKKLKKNSAKISKKRDGFGDWDRNLQLAAICAAAAVVLSIIWRATWTVGSTFGILGSLVSLAWLGAAVFLILWLIENV